MKRHGRNLNAYYEVKDTNMKRLNSVWFHLNDNLEKARLWKIK